MSTPIFVMLLAVALLAVAVYLVYLPYLERKAAKAHLETEAMLEAALDRHLAADEAWLAEIEAQKEAAFDQAVRGVREAEARGSLSPNSRSDVELKESIREMWEQDWERERQERKR